MLRIFPLFRTRVLFSASVITALLFYIIMLYMEKTGNSGGDGERRPDADLILNYVTLCYVMLFRMSEIQPPAPKPALESIQRVQTYH